MTVRKDFPPEFAEWECVLAMKKGEDRHVVHRRRDLWLVPHAQKLVARVVGESYDGVADTQVPGSQGGWEVNRGAPSMHVPLVVQKEMCWEQGRPLFRAFVDMGQFFSTIVREVQYRVERRMGVAPAITAVMRALQDGARGSTVTAYGRTEGWALQLGVGQGCVNATRRAKLQVAIIQRAVSQLCEGFDFADGAEEGAKVPQCVYADDGSFMADSLWGMQTCLDTCWWVCHVLGIQMIIKGKKKTAWQGRCWVGGRQQDVTVVVVHLPNRKRR